MTRVALGSLLLAGLLLVCVNRDAQRIQSDVSTRASTALAEAGLAWASASTDGRFVTLTGHAPDLGSKEHAVQVVHAVRGVVRVDDRTVVRPAEETEDVN